MDWFRMYHEARNDAKLRTLTDTQHRIWFNLLCLAAEQRVNRGTVPVDTWELLALEVANGDEDALRSTCDRLAKLRVVHLSAASIAFIHFEERQTRKAVDTKDQIRERVSRYRARQKQSNPVTECNEAIVTVTPCNDDVTQCNAEENRREEIREEEKRSEKATSNTDVAIATRADARKRASNGSSFHPPEPSETDAFFRDNGSTTAEASAFHDYYTSNGWRVGRTAMKDWRAAARGWIRRSGANSTATLNLTPSSNYVSVPPGWNGRAAQ